MSLLDHPEAQALLADAVLTPDAVRGCKDRLTAFLERYLPRFYRAEQRATASLVIGGLLSGLQRKTCEPIAVQAGVHRKPIQFFVGAGKWDDEAVMAELRRHVAEELGDDRAVLVIDGSTFPETGTGSCGVARQWCGRLGKQENCQAGVFLTYAAPGGYAPLDRRLYLPEDWAGEVARRRRCHVPEEITSQEKWRIAADLLERSREGLPPPGSRATTSSAARPTSAPGCGGATSATCSTCRATRSSATWSADAPGENMPAAASSGRCPTAGSTPGRPDSRRAAGRG